MNKKNDAVIKTLKKSMRLKVLLLLAIILTFNTFAWFIYSSAVSNSITTSVRAWKIEFENDSQTTQYIEFDIDDLYPGMPEYNNYINVVNYGETAATLTYEIMSFKVLGTEYTNPPETTGDLENIIENNYPFKINLNLTNSDLTPESGSSEFTINVKWPFESGDDEEDTLWGHRAYTYKQENPTLKQISINIKLTANQVNP